MWRLEELGMPVTPDDEPSWPRSVATVHAWGDAVKETSEVVVEQLAKTLIDAYLADPFWADAKRRVDRKNTNEPQPYPWNALLSEKVWRKHLDAFESSLSAGGVH